LLTSMVAENTN